MERANRRASESTAPVRPARARSTAPPRLPALLRFTLRNAHQRDSTRPWRAHARAQPGGPLDLDQPRRGSRRFTKADRRHPLTLARGSVQKRVPLRAPARRPDDRRGRGARRHRGAIRSPTEGDAGERPRDGFRGLPGPRPPFVARATPRVRAAPPGRRSRPGSPRSGRRDRRRMPCSRPRPPGRSAGH